MFIYSKSLTSLVYFFVLSLLYIGCKKFEPGYTVFSELGATQSEYVLPADEGSFQLKTLSNAAYKIYVSDSSKDWISTPVNQASKDTAFEVEYKENSGFARKGYIILSSDIKERYDTIVVKQQGSKVAHINFPENNISASGLGGKVTSILETNLDMEDIAIDIIYPVFEGDDIDSNFVYGWINEDFSYSPDDSLLSFSIKGNPDETELRSAQIKFSFKNGWGEEESSSLYLLQANANNQFGIETSFLEVRDWEGNEVSDNLFIEGYVVSDNKSKNMGDNIQSTPTKIDYTPEETTVYIEDVNGQYGFKVVTSTPEDNVFKRYSKVQLLLKGRSISKLPDVEAYTISGIKSSDVMSQVMLSANDIPKKELFMSELQDDDIYTFVSLKDCEIPVKKGSFTPINEGYSPAFNADRITKYPLIIRDINGSDMHLLTNMNVPYRRNGDRLPQGSGIISGIIVHEKFTRFNYEDDPNIDNYGNIGRYQIRPVDKSDIDISEDFNQGFSKILTEFIYPDIRSGKAYPTNEDSENGLLYASNDVNVYASSDYTYLGPIGADNVGNTNPLGNGVLINGAKQNTSTGTNSDGKGSTASASIAASRIWWNYEKERGEAFILEFSTQGVSSDNISMQWAALNWGSVNGPRFWRVEWSESGDMNSNDWELITEYTVPDVSNWSNTLLSQIPGYKNMTVNLPLSILGKSKVYVRLIVDKNIGSDGFSYATVPLEGDVNSSLSYLSIRYNK